MAAQSRVLLVGCGGIGGVIAAGLSRAGTDVTVVTGNASIAEALRARGAEVVDQKVTSVSPPIEAFERLPEGKGPFDLVLLATQPTQVEQAARDALAHLSPDGRMVCLQNGLCEARVARIVGEGRVAGAIVAWGGTQLGPGRYERTARGGFVVGYDDGHVDAHLTRLSHLLEPIGPVDVTHNLRGARFSKLAINCAISALGTIGGDRLGRLMRHRVVRRLALELMTEAVQVARAEGVRLEKVSGTLDLDWIALTDEERRTLGSPGLLAKHALLLAVGAKYRRMRSSMLSAIERGRTPPVDFLNGEITTRGEAHRIEVPVNERARQLVHMIAQKQATPSLELVRRLYRETAGVRAREVGQAA